MRLNICLVGAAMLLTAGAVSAEDIDCNSPKTQSDMTACESGRHEAADKALNAQYKKTRAALAAIDKDLDGDRKGAEQALVKAQRAWIDYRYAECDAFGFQARGGTMEPMLVAGCLANITDKRTKELRELEDTMSN
ncbi:lysozyme inhibitor LprI family protein [Rhizobium sp. WYCCWR 11128]|uniref:lysozyme inhibitor LprI family protein n=1 Tax=Rhizobium sp. WYCCWR 11128 TaxID=2749832 RepID=UPI0015D27AC2|nr:lysozyme inhibitor LprI family protein [Rhizobium sp. WYCCWR 11128]NYT31902.1 DUF1311 domain-containing protein [Rhizobium sp. WYCCWR 11128]